MILCTVLKKGRHFGIGHFQKYIVWADIDIVLVMIKINMGANMSELQNHPMKICHVFLFYQMTMFAPVGSWVPNGCICIGIQICICI